MPITSRLVGSILPARWKVGRAGLPRERLAVAAAALALLGAGAMIWTQFGPHALPPDEMAKRTETYRAQARAALGAPAPSAAAPATAGH